MMNDSDILIDEKSGISVEEQKEILTQINGIAEKNRRRLSEKEPGDGKKFVVNAKKSGSIFPMAVNIAAVAVLLGGILFLVLFFRQMDNQIRTGGAVEDLVWLHVEQGLDRSEELNAAMRELNRLTNEQERIDGIDALVSSGLVSINNSIKDSEYDEAIGNIAILRQFLNNVSLPSSHAFQSRRISYNQSLDFAESIIEEAIRQSDLLSIISQRENTIGGMQGTIDFLDLTLAERDNTITSLENQRSTLNQTITARDSAITSLENQRNTLNQTITERDGTISSLAAENTRLRNLIETALEVGD